jgi:hypothetical protein
VRRSKGALAAIAIVPDAPSPTEPAPAARWAFQSYYLAAYGTAKRADKNITMLGAGSARSTVLLLGQELLSYIDAVAACDAATDAAMAETFLAAGSPGKPRPPLWILPAPAAGESNPIPPAAALARNAVVVPVPPSHVDHGVTAHLLNGVVFIQRVNLASLNSDAPAPLPFIALFQGDGYSVAAIAGPSAGTELDASLPGLARSRTVVEPERPDEKPRFANLEISDDTHAMRVVDAQGEVVDCRFGDSIFAPAEDKVVYLLQAGRADDLAGSLRPARANRLPLFEVAATLPANSTALNLDLKNVAFEELSAKMQIVLPERNNAPAVVLGEKEVTTLAPGKTVQIAIDLTADQIRQLKSSPLVIEIRTQGGTSKPMIQRTTVSLESVDRLDR